MMASLKIWLFLPAFHTLTSAPNCCFVVFFSIRLVCRSALTAAFLAFLSSFDSFRGRIIVSRRGTISRLKTERDIIGKHTVIVRILGFIRNIYSDRVFNFLWVLNSVNKGRKTCFTIKSDLWHWLWITNADETGVVLKVCVSC